jgi:PKD repeat protein
MNGATMGELHIDLYDGTQWIENVIPAIIGNQGTAWKQGVVNLQPFVGNIINIRFRGITGSSFTSDLALDDINISEVTAAPIAAFTTSTNNTCTNNAIQLTDASINIPQTWSWQITPATFNYVNNTNATTGNPVVVFNATGIYTVQLTVTNTNGQDSLTQTNLINVANGGTIPYIENFNAFSFPNPAISLQNPDNGDTWETVTTVGSDGSSTQALYVNNFNYNAVGEEDALVLTFDLTNETAATLKFDVAHARYSGTYSDGIRIDAYTDCGNTFASTLYNKSGAALATAPDQTTTFSPNSAAQWRNETVDLSNFIGNIVTLKIINVCGYGNNTYLDNINIDTTSIIPVTLQANITRSGGDYCVGMPVTFYNNSIGTNLTYNWDFGTNATPSTATTAGPHNVTYNSNGLQTAKLTITDSNGDKDSTSATVFVSGIAVANFNLIQQNDSTIKLFYGGLYTNTFQWYFGDGNVSTVQNPLYTYDSSGTFTVSLIVQGDCGDDTLTQDVIIQLVNTNNIFNTAENITVFPNPTNGIFQITINGLKEKANLKLIDVQGRIIKTWNTESTATILQKNLDITEVPSGIYFLHIQTDKSSDIIKLLKE